MAQQKTFRTAFNGFNREDVVHYIEYMNAKHQSEVNQLKSEIEFLRGQSAEAPAPVEVPVEADPAEIEALEEKLRAALAEKYQASTQLETALAEKAELEAKLAAALADKAQAQADAAAAVLAKEQAETQQNTVQCRIEQELEAYRRAERTERLARERAEQVYHRVNGVLADATVKVDDAAAQIGELTDQVMAHLNQLQGAVTDSKQALRDAAETMYAIRPNGNEE